VFFRLSGAVRDDADSGAIQPYEVSHLSESILVNVNGTADPLIGKKSQKALQKALGSDLHS